MSRKNIIEVKNLFKQYGNFTAVNDVSFTVREGSLFAFLGPNGAGKSTTINSLTTYIDYDGGEININGFDAKTHKNDIRRCIGAVFQESVLDKFLTVKENICYRAALYGIKGADFAKRYSKISEQFSLGEIENRKYGFLSGGQKRRTDIARALIHTPKVLFLDEPNTGLDPQTRLTVWENIKQIQDQDKVTIFLTTHYMEEAAIADYVVMMDSGKIIVENTPENLMNQYSSSKLKIKAKNPEKFIELGYVHKKDFFSVNVKDCFEGMKIANKYKADIEFFEIVQGNMDDVFLELTGKALREV